MANAGGRFPSFDPTAGKSWSIYYQRFVFHCKAKKITTDEGMKAEFIACIEDETFEYIQALVNKQLSDDTLTFANIASAIEDQYVEPDNEIEASATFHARNQQPGESVKDFVAELRRLAIPCRFGVALERTLRDRIVLGIISVETRALLFRTPKGDLTVEKVIITARGVESSQRQALATANGTIPLHFMGRPLQLKQAPNRGASNNGGNNKKGQQPHTSATPTCRRCDGTHEAANCKYKNTVCDFCNIKGHIAAACNSKKRAERQNGAKGKPRQQPHRQPQPNQNQGLHATSATGDQEGVPTSQGSDGQDDNLYYCEYSFFYLTEQEQVAHISATEREAALKLPPPLMKTVHIDGKKMEMELDQGCPIALINEATFNANWPGTELEPVPFQLQTWTFGQVGLQGFFKVTVTDGSLSATLPLFVGPGGGGRPLLGRQWFAPLGLRVVQDSPGTSILHTPQAKPSQPTPATGPASAPAAAPVQPSLPEPQRQRQEQDAFKTLPKDLREYECLRPGLGMYKGKPVSLEVDPTVRPKFCKARKVPFARRGPVEQEIQRNVDLGVWRGPIAHSKWATAIVPVFKPDRGPRLCGDYRSTLNQALPMDNYPMPTIEEAFASLAGSSVFTKLDLKEAYTQVPVDEASAQLLTVSTHKGLFTVHRLPFGISVAPTLFQRVITSLLSGIDGVVVWLDDLLISGKDNKTHDARLKEVLRRLSDAGLRLHPNKCVFHQTSVEYLGFHVDATGTRPLQKRVVAITNAPAPHDVKSLRAFMGKLNFYDKFLPDRATALEPLYRLTEKDSAWKWGPAEQAAFQEAKSLLATDKLLVHYDLQKDIIVSADASPYGVGCVIAHVYPDGTERPIEYASRTLTAPERNYSQLDKEALSIVFAVTKWHQYLAGRKFRIATDHKPLLGIFGQHKKFPEICSPRMERWLLKMGCYAYSMEYRPGKDHCNCDALSRLPIPGRPAPTPEPPEIFLMTGTPSPHLTAADVAAATLVDPTLSQVLEWTRCGWPRKDPGGEFSKYFSRRDALSTMRDCLLWGSRVVVPAALHDRALRHLHAAHMGIVRTKALARVLLWWPGLSSRIEHMVNTCRSCQATRAHAPHLPVAPWQRPDAPWSRLHIDYAGPFRGRYFLVLVDAYSGWCDAFATAGPTTEATITCLNQCFRYNGSPFTLVSDNGTAFTSHRFRSYCAQRGIKQLFTAPRCPSSNGAAERLVRTLKETLRRLPGGDLQANLDLALDGLRQTPGRDGRTPWEKLSGRPVRTALSLVLPAPVQDIPEQAHKYAVGDPVHYKPFGEEEWQPATVAMLKGGRMLIIEDAATPGFLATRHVDQIRRRVPGMSPSSSKDSSLSSPQAAPRGPAPRPSGAPAVLMDGTVCLEKEKETAARTPMTSPQGPATGALSGTPRTPVHGRDLGNKRRRSFGRGLTPLESQLRREEARRPGGPRGPGGPGEREPRMTRNPNPNYKV